MTSWLSFRGASDPRTGPTPASRAGRVRPPCKPSVNLSAEAWILTVLLVTTPLCILCATYLDIPLARLSGTVSPRTKLLADAFSDLGLSGYMLIISGVLALGGYRLAHHTAWPVLRRHSMALVGERALFVFSAVALSGLLAQAIKHVVGRARPSLIDTLGAYHFDHFSMNADFASFPSGHSTSVFALAAGLSLIAPRISVLVFPLAFAVSATRIVLDAHYMSDILAGGVLGCVTAVALAFAFADKSIAFRRRHDVLRLKGVGLVFSGLRARSDLPRSAMARTAP